MYSTRIKPLGAIALALMIASPATAGDRYHDRDENRIIVQIPDEDGKHAYGRSGSSSIVIYNSRSSTSRSDMLFGDNLRYKGREWHPQYGHGKVYGPRRGHYRDSDDEYKVIEGRQAVRLKMPGITLVIPKKSARKLGLLGDRRGYYYEHRHR